MNTGDVDEAIAMILAGEPAQETAGELTARAAALESDAMTAAARPSILMKLAAELRAKAGAITGRDAAMAALDDAESALRDAEVTFADTAGPEQVASGRALLSGQAHETAFRAEQRAVDASAEVAELIELRQRTSAAREVAAHEETRLTEAMAARERARLALDKAGERAHKARERAEAAAAAVDAPMDAALDIGARVTALFWTWPMLVTLDLAGHERMDPQDKAIARELCRMLANQLGVGGADAEKKARREAAREMYSIPIVLPGGLQTTVGSMLGQAGPRAG